MTDPATFWNTRYGEEEYAYGTEPNAFFREQLAVLPPGRLLLPAEGEGRNAVYAARLGWEVFAFDISEAGRRKALALAVRHAVAIDYRVGGVAEVDYPEGSFDVLGLFFAHFPGPVRRAYHARLCRYLCPGGRVIFEAFSRDQPAYQDRYDSGGPRDPAMLFSTEDIPEEFPGFTIDLLRQEEVVLTEGRYHAGPASVVRFVGGKG